MPLTKVTRNLLNTSIEDNGTSTAITIGADNSVTFSSTISASGYNNSNWDTAYSWGNHASQSYATQSYVNTQVANLVDSAPSALDTLNELASALGDDANFSTTVTNSIATKWTQDNAKISNWDTAYSWGNHASAGYLTSFTESDPTVPSHVKSITSANISNWNTAYGWGDHASAGYLDTSSTSQTKSGDLTVDQLITTNNANGTNVRIGDDAWIGDCNSANQIRIQGTNDATKGYISFGSTSNTALGRSGNGDLTWGGGKVWHEGNDGNGSGLDADKLQGHLPSYFTGYTDTAIANLVDSSPSTLNTLNELAAALGDDANFSTTVSNQIGTKWTQDNTKISNWDTAYGWGNHASAGYLTGNQTITLSGDVSGSGTTSINVTVADNSHNHSGSNITSGTVAAARIANLDASKITSGTFNAARIPHNAFDIGDTTAETGRSVHETGIYTFNRNNGTLGAGTDSAYYSVLGFGQGTGGMVQIAGKWTSPHDKLYWRSLRDTTDNWWSWKAIFHDTYHPNADKWTTARTLSLTGDVTGSVSWDGSANASLTTTIADDSHNHVISNVDGLQSALDAKLASSSYTASDVLTKIKTVDGSGSGLDADTVDGKNSTDFTYYRGIVSGNWDTIFTTGTGKTLTSGLYEVHNITSGSHSNYPSGAYTYGGVFAWYLNNSTFKLYAPHTGQLHYQTGWNNDEYSGWRKIWDTGNDGSGSGLDADTVDGLQASQFLRSDATDTMAGGLRVTGGSYSSGIDTGNIGIAIDKGEFIYSDDGNYLRIIAGHNSAGKIQIGQSGTALITGIDLYSGTSGNNTLTLNGNKIWNAGNDGSGSGLDADLVDGIDSSRIIFGANSTGTTGNYQPSQTLKSGFYDIYNNNTPTGTWYSFINMRHNNASNNYGHQIAGSFYDNNLWNRNINNGSFGAWSKSWSSNNDGSGSGLDADLLDGVHASSFARKDTSTRQDFTGSIKVSTNNATGGGIVLADDGDIVDLNDGYCSMRFSYGVRVYSANSGGSVSHTLHSNGSFTASGNVTAYSDIRLKENIEVIPDAVNKVQQLRGVTFTRNDQEDKEQRHAGVIAQEVEEVLPEVVATDDQGIKHVAYGNMVGLLVEAIKELKTEVDDLKTQLEKK